MSNEPHQELVIIRRHASHEDGHHGGAWKIAFADFMTAMMALFLVLWLISATNPKQRIVIARYFNPVKITEATSNKKGLNDPDDGGGPAHTPPKSGEPTERRLDLPQDKRSLFEIGAQPTHDEAAMFRDPYAVLSEIAAQASQTNRKDDSPGSGGGGSKSEAVLPADTGETFRDPFATVPQPEQDQAVVNRDAAASVQAPAVQANQNEKTVPSAPENSQSAASVVASETPAAKPPEASQTVNPAPPPVAKEKPAASPKEATKPQAPARAAAEQPMSPQAAAELRAQLAAADMHSNEAEAGKLQSEIATAMHKDSATQMVPNVEVKNTSEGVLISLTDEASYAMFSVGSAEPQQKTIEVMGKVAQLLKSHPGQIIIRGHTDGRPYKSGTYDNWQLSAARAQMAHYMLVRGGLDEKRIERIEGYADHRLKAANDPLAAENRRIEILVRKEKL